MEQRFMSLKEASVFLGLTERALRRRVAREQIPLRRWGKKLVFNVEELNAFIAGLPGVDVAQAETSKKPN